MSRPLTFREKAARLQAAAPWLSHSEICATLQAHAQAARRARLARNHGRTFVTRTAERDAVETPVRHDWQRRADLQ